MKAKTCLATLIIGLALWPGLAAAQHVCESTQTVTCPEGQSWDSATQSCIIPLNS